VIQADADLANPVIEYLIEKALPATENSVELALHDLRCLIDASARAELLGRVRAALSGYGLLTPLITENTTDLLINGCGAVWRDQGAGLELCDLRFTDPAETRQLAVRLAVSAGRRLDEAQPYVDAQLPDGVRLHAVLHPISAGGPVVSLRFPRTTILPLGYWVDSMPREFRSTFEKLVAHRATMVISGATGSGKTTLVRSLMVEVAPRRIVVIEDTAELGVAQPHVVALQGRLASAEGRGLITARDLVRQSLRMRPDSIVIGEVRGVEVLDWLLAVTSGHAGSLTTVHAHSSSHALERLELLAALSGLSTDFVRTLVIQSVDAIVHCTNTDGRRRIDDVHVLNQNFDRRLHHG